MRRHQILDAVEHSAKRSALRMRPGPRLACCVPTTFGLPLTGITEHPPILRVELEQPNVDKLRRRVTMRDHGRPQSVTPTPAPA